MDSTIPDISAGVFLFAAMFMSGKLNRGGMTTKKTAVLALAVVAIVTLGGAGAYLLTMDDAETGGILIYVKDAPADWRHLNVTFSSVMVHQADYDYLNDSDENETDDDCGVWINITLEQQTIDLKAYVNISALLASGNISTGRYTQVRIVVDSVTGVRTDGTQVEFTVPSGELKIIKMFTIEKDETTRLTVDIDLDKSITEASGSWIFKPVLGSIVES